MSEDERPDIIDVDDRVREGSTSQIQTMPAYREHWARAEADPSGYWLAQAKQRVHWRKPPTQGLHGDFWSVREDAITWFADGELNVTESCLDRHLERRGDKAAIVWEGDEPGEARTLSYAALHAEVCRCANALTALGLKRVSE